MANKIDDMDIMVDFYRNQKPKKKKKKSYNEPKKKKKKADPDMILFEKELDQIEVWAKNFILRINEIDKSKFNPEKDDFKKKSVYSYSMKPLPISSREWKVKFLSFYITEVVGNLDEITTNICIDLDTKKKVWWSMKRRVLQRVSYDLKILASSMLNRKKYGGILKQSNLCSVYMTECRYKDYQGIKEVLKSIKNGIRKGYNDDIILNDFFLLSYALGAGDFKFNKLPPFKAIEGKSRQSDFRNLLIQFGKCCRKELKRKDAHPMLYAFYRSAPIMVSTYKGVNEDKDLNTAVLILSYAVWVCGDERIRRFISEVLGR